ncbi:MULTISPECIES: TetR/AcrR family transcriptional regulator [Mumia]|uniref:TetR/AcrR family transcriptional regulator n=1 Tax=Mumia xiangluensis TaxID=1678900 RepID=A0ABW1QSU9_9ACTN|nr:MULTISPECIES: TetR/AcrR family transcriptional regulator [Mumia]
MAERAGARARTGAGRSLPKSHRTRERILDAAARVLGSKGYAGTRLQDVAAEAGLQAPAIYYYFGSRDELIAEVMYVGAHRVRGHVIDVLAALPVETDAMGRILAAVEAHLRYELLISDYTTASVRNAGQVPESVRERAAAEEAAYSHMWRDLFEQAQAAGELRSDLDLNLTRFLIIGAMNWAAEWWDPKHRTLDDLVASTQALVLNGVGRH